jgi:hypothetical protein
MGKREREKDGIYFSPLKVEIMQTLSTLLNELAISPADLQPGGGGRGRLLDQGCHLIKFDWSPEWFSN